jgi:hypothetical protein
VDTQKGQGNHGTEVKYRSTGTEQLKLDFVLDGTQTMEGYSGKTTDYKSKPVVDQLHDFLNCVYKMNGAIHRPNFLIVMWGSEIKFRCVLSNLDINYTLFEPDGSPLRIKISATFLHHKSKEEILAESKLASPDLTHYAKTKEGDRLDYISYQTYKDNTLFQQIGKHNSLTNIRRLKTGIQISFPPLSKNNK